MHTKGIWQRKGLGNRDLHPKMENGEASFGFYLLRMGARSCASEALGLFLLILIVMERAIHGRRILGLPPFFVVHCMWMAVDETA